jgi:metal-responsive CopG/Arc/MetJ family transcriptional regulator
MTTITIDIPEDQYLEIQKFAAEDGVSVEEWIIEALRKYLERQRLLSSI